MKDEVTYANSTIQRVLVMDDEELLRDLAKQMLPRIGYEVEVACDGVEAIDLYRRPWLQTNPLTWSYWT